MASVYGTSYRENLNTYYTGTYRKSGTLLRYLIFYNELCIKDLRFTLAKSHCFFLPFALAGGVEVNQMLKKEVAEIRQTPGAELLGIIHRKLGNRIECSHRHVSITPWDAVQFLLGVQIAGR